ncbi:threonylcarbamoyl-AMP synthase [Bacillus taeanensis]|uniref:Threonylcarbamoyl-AMP synthase n=1 Tax=Bacillus taeanensis TaxID=273032 RepID=A0A366XXN3_9BACI|nr:L-threonylcarbamoyladenylate synthase [Bacillus taeanensis]RBW68711.1 threonylcarbamoyl-AMP synthase [Bacillus taeanensis]
MTGIKTYYWTVDEDSPESYPQVEEASLWIKKNEVIAFPTETVYGLGGNALSDEAIEKIFKAKGRPSDNPLIVHIAKREQLQGVVSEIPENAEKLMAHFWPGPLTLVMPKGDVVSEKVTAGLQTVAVRMPDHPVALALLRYADLPVAAPSANLSGKPSPTAAKHVYEDLDGRIAGIVDGGPTGVGVESTVVDCTTDIVTILRPGGVTKEELEAVVGDVAIDPALLSSGQAPKSPGMKYTHYAPKAPLTLVSGSQEMLQKLVNDDRKLGKKVGVLTTEENKHAYDADIVIACGTRSDLSTVANRLYDVLRAFDYSHVDNIYSEVFPQEGVGAAVMNRLEKAAGGRTASE